MSEPGIQSGTESALPTKRPRGRRPGIRVPCDECIARASQNQDKSADIPLCERCIAVLQQPKRAQETASLRQVGRRSRNIVDTAPGALCSRLELAHAGQGHDTEDRMPGTEVNAAPENVAIHAHRPSTFASLHEAGADLRVVESQLLMLFMDLDLDDQVYDMATSSAENCLLYRSWLQSWETAFTAFLQCHHGAMTHEERKAAMVLKAHHLMCEILSQADLSAGELAWYTFYQEFKAIVDLSSAVVENAGQADASIVQAGFGASVTGIAGVVGPLCEVCARCPDPVLRAQALSLVTRHARQELMSSSWSAWKVGKFILRAVEADFVTSTDMSAETEVSGSWSSPMDQRGLGGSGTADSQIVPRVIPRYALNPGLFEGDQAKMTHFADIREAATSSCASVIATTSAAAAPTLGGSTDRA